MHLLITQLTLSDNHRCLTLLIRWSSSILLSFNLKIAHLAVWVICIWIQIEFCSLMFWVNFCSVFERLQNLTRRLTMLVFVCVRRLNIHSIFLGLKLFEELAIVLLLVIRLGPVAVHALSTTVIASLIMHLLLSARVEIFDPNILLLRLSFATWVKYIDCFMCILFFLVFYVADI